MKDTYKDFKDLLKHEKDGLDFKVEMEDRGSRYAIIAIHGGNIEPATTEIARAIAGEDFSFYSFIGKKPREKDSEKLHITSIHFDDPRCRNLVSTSDKAVSIHGLAEKGEFVMLGGLDDGLIGKVSAALAENCFATREASENVNGNSPQNICNRCSSKKGLQLELSRGLRDRLLEDRPELSRFCDTVRSTITS